jgi:hypothetical protein
VRRKNDDRDHGRHRKQNEHDHATILAATPVRQTVFFFEIFTIAIAISGAKEKK